MGKRVEVSVIGPKLYRGVGGGRGGTRNHIFFWVAVDFSQKKEKYSEKSVEGLPGRV